MVQSNREQTLLQQEMSLIKETRECMEELKATWLKTHSWNIYCDTVSHKLGDIYKKKVSVTIELFKLQMEQEHSSHINRCANICEPCEHKIYGTTICTSPFDDCQHRFIGDEA